MTGIATEHDAMSFQWTQEDMPPKSPELWEQLDSSLTDEDFQGTSRHLLPSGQQVDFPSTNTLSSSMTLGEFMAQRGSRPQKPAVSSTRSSSTIRPSWRRRPRTDNIGAMFTVGPSSSESDMSEADVVDIPVESLFAEYVDSHDPPPNPSKDALHSDGDSALDLQYHCDIMEHATSRSTSDQSVTSDPLHFETSHSNRQLLSTVAEEDASETAVYGLSNEPLPTGDAVLHFAPQHGAIIPTINTNSHDMDKNLSRDNHQQHETTQTRRKHRGAELQLQMTDARLEDSDSSWTEADDQQEWYIHIQTQLAAFRKQSSRLSLVTSLLNTIQRKQVHAMAKMMGLSHLSLGKGKLKRLLLAKCELAQTFGSMPPNRRWISHRQHWISGWADPRLLVVENIRWDVPQEEIGSFITKSLAAKQVSAACQSLVTHQQHTGLYAAYIAFKTPEDAASALLALDSDRPQWNEWPLGCEYIRLPGASRVIDLPTDLNRLARAANHLWLAEQDCSDLPTLDDLPTFPANPSSMVTAPAIPDMTRDVYNHFAEDNQPTLDDVTQATGSFAESIPMSRMVSSTSTSSDTYSSNIGQVSLGASTSMTSLGSLVLSDYGSEASAAKKRKRQPATVAGYKCSNAGCDKSFHRMGDLRKHQKIHSPFRPHHCGVCGQGFLYPKDLRRHQTNKGHVQLGDELAQVPEDGGLMRSWSCSAI